MDEYRKRLRAGVLNRGGLLSALYLLLIAVATVGYFETERIGWVIGAVVLITVLEIVRLMRIAPPT